MNGPVLVTGSAGSLGTALCDVLKKREITPVYGYDLKERMDILDLYTLSGVMQDTQPRIVYHLAGAKAAGYGEENPWRTTRTNIEGTQNVLESLPEDCQMILASSCKAANPETVYGATKLIAERMVLNAGHSVARLYNVRESSGNVFRIWEEIPEDDSLPVTTSTRWFVSIEAVVDLLLKIPELPPGRYAPNARASTMARVAQKVYPERKTTAIPLRRGDRAREPAYSTSESFERVGDVLQITSRHDV